MIDQDPCEICQATAETQPERGFDGIQQSCPRCGTYKITGSAQSTIRNVPPKDRPKLSGYVRDQNALNEIPELTASRIRSLCAAPLPGIIGRADRLLRHAVRSKETLGARINLTEPEYIGVTYSQDSNEVRYLAKLLADEKYIAILGDPKKADVTPKGYIRDESQRSKQSASAQGFVAMWFDKYMQTAYDDGFEPGIRGAGYDPLRVDSVEHTGKIDDEIIAQIRRSRFVVADFTGHRGGVYFEAGFALGLDLPVIWSCRQSDLGGLHFDIRQFNCIDWNDERDLSRRLQKRIEAVIGVGPHKI